MFEIIITAYGNTSSELFSGTRTEAELHAQEVVAPIEWDHFMCTGHDPEWEVREVVEHEEWDFEPVGLVFAGLVVFMCFLQVFDLSVGGLLAYMPMLTSFSLFGGRLGRMWVAMCSGVCGFMRDSFGGRVKRVGSEAEVESEVEAGPLPAYEPQVGALLRSVGHVRLLAEADDGFLTLRVDDDQWEDRLPFRVLHIETSVSTWARSRYDHCAYVQERHEGREVVAYAIPENMAILAERVFQDQRIASLRDECDLAEVSHGIDSPEWETPRKAHRALSQARTKGSVRFLDALWGFRIVDETTRSLVTL